MSNILFMCIITRALFFRPRIFTLFGSTALFVLLFLSTRTSYPRLRYDLLIRFFWLYLLPVMVLGIFASSVQALVFSTLSAAYIAESIE
jgi:NADH:ubiquinone oxidoreductase subunit H